MIFSANDNDSTHPRGEVFLFIANAIWLPNFANAVHIKIKWNENPPTFCQTDPMDKRKRMKRISIRFLLYLLDDLNGRRRQGVAM